MARFWLSCLAFLYLGCSSNSDKPPVDVTADLDRGTDVQADVASETVDAREQPDVVALPEPSFLWPGESPRPALSPWFDSHPWIDAELSAWSYQVDTGGDKPHFRFLPDHAVGNGHVFSLFGYTYPLNTMHSSNGPYYHKGERFFSDVWVELAVGTGNPLAWQHQGSAKATTLPLVLTWAKAPQATLLTVDFAPLVGDQDEPARRALVRLAVVHNPGANPIKGLVLKLKASGPQEVVETSLVEQVETRRRTLTIDDANAEVVNGALQLALDAIGPGEDVVVPIAVIFDDEKEMTTDTLQALTAATVDGLLDDTREAWLAKLQPAARLVTPDPRVNDYLASQLLVVLTQQAFNGSSHPMCEYTRTWLRDNAGPARLLTRIGLFEALRAQLDYLHLAGVVGGGISNSYDGFFTPEDAGEEPDWANMPTITGRSRAESPSYIPLMFSWYREVSGQEDFIEPYFDWMKFALEGQMFDGDLLPFSTDETFRTAMAVAHGLVVDEQFEEGFYSANSSFLWVAAAERLADMAEAIGKTEDAAALRTRAQAVRATCEETFLAGDGHYHPYVHSEDLAPAPAPFEDVNTKPIWAGYLPADSAEARANLAQTIAALDGDDGYLVSPLPDVHKNIFGLPITEGIHTGMSPGYFLDNLARTDHPAGEAAFNALALHATASATTAEYQILDDHTPLHFLYDSAGAVGDYTARYRPWEGGILADAAWSYLLGNRADALNQTLHLAPHLPNGWSWLEAKALRVGETRVDVRFELVEGAWTIALQHVSGDPLTIELSLPVASTAPTCLVDGASADCPTTANHWDESLHTASLQLELTPAAPLTVTVE